MAEEERRTKVKKQNTTTQGQYIQRVKNYIIKSPS
jgi:hypothetical protein